VDEVDFVDVDEVDRPRVHVVHQVHSVHQVHKLRPSETNCPVLPSYGVEMTLVRLAIALVLALPLAADPLVEVRAALGKLTASAPIRATYELQRSVSNAGKLDNDAFSGKAVVLLESDGGDFRLVVQRPLLQQIVREQESRTQDVNKKTPTVSALSQVDPVETANAIDFAPTLLRMLHGAKIVSDTQSTFQGKPARAMVLRLPDRIEKEDAGRVKISENRLTLWLGADHIPLGAEHLLNAKFSFLIFKGESKQKKSWYFAQVADRLVRVRHESTESGSGMGQKSSETVLATLKVH
jgi:hypothetical protein